MGKNKSRASAVRKIDPVDQVTVTETVSVSGSDVGSANAVLNPNAKVEAKAGVNPIVSAGHTMEGLAQTYKTKSAVIRFLNAQGFATKHIAVFMDIRYQHVRNVLTTVLKKPAGATMESPVGNNGQPADAEPEAE